MTSPARPVHFGGRRTRNPPFGRPRPPMSPVPLRLHHGHRSADADPRSLDVAGRTPHLGIPRLAPGRMEPDSPVLPDAAGSLPASSPSKKNVPSAASRRGTNLRTSRGHSTCLGRGPSQRRVPGGTGVAVLDTYEVLSQADVLTNIGGSHALTAWRRSNAGAVVEQRIEELAQLSAGRTAVDVEPRRAE